MKTQRNLDSPMHLWAMKNTDIKQNITGFESHLIEQGYEVEKKAKIYLEMYIANKPEYHEIIWQETYSDKKCQVTVDALIYNSNLQSYDLYEIKSSTKIKNKNLEDVTFQFLVLNKLLPINKMYILHLNKDYIRQGDLDLQKLFIANDVTEKIHNLKPTSEEKINDAFQIMQKKSHLGIAACSKPKICPYRDLCHPDLPSLSIYDVPRLHKSKITKLRNNNIISMQEIPDNFELSEKQRAIVSAAKKNCLTVNRGLLKEELKKLIFPLYFLDYETYNSAIPLFDGYSPQQHIVFQYSLHIVEKNDLDLQHYEFLAKQKNDTIFLLESLKQHIGATGSVLVWNKTFEIGRNKEMALRYPAYADFLNDLNNRIYDLADPINKGHYVHPKFKGSWSIKNVLPVMVSNLSYKTLEIQKGDEAMLTWWDLANKNTNHNNDFSPEQQKKAQSLLDYCKLDTLAMVKIWQKFNEL